MKNKDISVLALQESINARLQKFDGVKYEGIEFHSWYASEIAEEFAARGITELRVSTWNIRADIGGPIFIPYEYADVAAVTFDAKRDKRFKRSGGRGVINTLRVAFRAELLPLTLDEARRLLLTAKRDRLVEQHTNAITEHRAAIARAEEKLAALNAIDIQAAAEKGGAHE